MQTVKKVLNYLTIDDINDGFDTIMVSNLDSSTKENDLLEIFKPYGNIVSCKIEKNDGNESYIAYVKYQYEKEAENAISKMNGQKIKDNQITVQPYENIKVVTREIKLEDLRHNNSNMSTSSHVDDVEDDDEFDDDD